MLEGMVSYFHQPTHTLHGLRLSPAAVTRNAEQKGSVEEKNLIFKKIGGKVKNFSDPLAIPDCLVLSQLSQNTFNTVLIDQDQYF